MFDARRLLLCGALLTLPACAAKVPPVVTAAPTPAPVPVAAQTAAASPVAAPASVDPVGDLLRASALAEARAERQLVDGHRGEARRAFDDALDPLLLTAPAIRGSGPVRDRIAHLIERVAAVELDARIQDAELVSAADASPLDTILALPPVTPPGPVTAARVAEDLSRTRHDIDIPLNARVLGFVELFTGRLKGFIEDALERGSRFLPMIQATFAQEGIPTDLAFIPVVESAFNPNALSRARAKGLWQFMRGTAGENGLRTDWFVDERNEPDRATRAAAKYLKSLYGNFGDWHLALASYNGGPGRVQRALARSRTDDFWSLTASTRYLPRETRDYVPLILAAAIIARNPAHYGVAVPPPAPSSVPDEVDARGPVDLRRLAEALDRPVAELKTLNPALRRWATPPGDAVYRLRVPAGTAAAATAFLDATDGDAAFLWHTVKKGETLAVVARRYKVPRSELAEANALSARAAVRPGQRLIVPREPGVVTPGASERLTRAAADADAPTSRSKVTAKSGKTGKTGKPGKTAKTTKKTGAARAAAPASGSARGAATPGVHRVRRGETLASIAARYATTVADLRRWNHLSGSGLKVGTRLTVRPPAAP